MKTTRKILTTVVCILVLLLANTLTVSATVMPGYSIEDNVPVDEWQDVVDELKFSSFKQEPSVKRAIKSLATDRNVMAICTRSWNKAIILVYNNYGEFVIGYELTTFGRVTIGFDVQGLVIHNVSSGHKLYLDDDGDIAYLLACLAKLNILSGHSAAHTAKIKPQRILRIAQKHRCLQHHTQLPCALQRPP